jgi:hypothetical protein
MITLPGNVGTNPSETRDSTQKREEQYVRRSVRWEKRDIGMYRYIYFDAGCETPTCCL